MSFFPKFFAFKTEISFDEKKEAFLAVLLNIEEKYTLYFNRKLQEIPLELPDQLQNYYLLRKEFEYLRFDYMLDSDLPIHIKQECDEAYQKIWGNK
ncbi:hypothetical protein AHMF7605_23760 [Adhaeribacter arboris]|uniref:Uncharacterized protein n=1 Tax=Adhaeribacter arboris TaxID=2072846 RepID=A0A2T2YLB3_9BACT|nr:hypothetical protein [Adhaeribacter arboris]PSR56298.1 hypothetical protein AHMF7605_23760 [Adhaeribacter arboris]